MQAIPKRLWNWRQRKVNTLSKNRQLVSKRSSASVVHVSLSLIAYVIQSIPFDRTEYNSKQSWRALQNIMWDRESLVFWGERYFRSNAVLSLTFRQKLFRQRIHNAFNPAYKVILRSLLEMDSILLVIYRKVYSYMLLQEQTQHNFNYIKASPRRKMPGFSFTFPENKLHSHLHYLCSFSIRTFFVFPSTTVTIQLEPGTQTDQSWI